MENSCGDNNQKVIICVSGMTGSGKSTVAKKLAEKYELNYFSGGNAMRILAKEEGYHSEVNGWWESSEGLAFLQKRKEDPSFDKKIDEKLLELAEEGNVVLDSWTVPWLLKAKGFKIWLEASPQVRATRVLKRDGMTAEEALKALTEKDEETRQIYKKLYGFELGHDLTPFNLVLSTDDLDPDDIFYAVSVVTDRLVFGKH
ncbi:MAG: cytidylate kinase family protein [Candidatus Bathyarchaeota archaeon]|nr:MAG: cytidylate kinase family protein [Candidatus Bathyarchaeum tardum]WNZ28607.1 MAG: cytidylate kinase family protein [Candidatus Bathyarchaeota archaeon]